MTTRTFARALLTTITAAQDDIGTATTDEALGRACDAEEVALHDLAELTGGADLAALKAMAIPAEQNVATLSEGQLHLVDTILANLRAEATVAA